MDEMLRDKLEIKFQGTGLRNMTLRLQKCRRDGEVYRGNFVGGQLVGTLIFDTFKSHSTR